MKVMGLDSPQQGVCVSGGLGGQEAFAILPLGVLFH